MKIVVAYGGTSPEREVSLSSGAAVAKALAEAGFEVILEDVESPSCFINKWPSFGADGVFIALHGGWGENGRLQACLEAFGIPYTGSGPEACMIAMDKSKAKLVFSSRKIPVAAGLLKRKGSKCGSREAALFDDHSQLIVKPNCGGSTVGVSRVASMEELEAGLAEAWKIEDEALIEAFIPGREITVTVWEKENGEVIALPAIDIRPKCGFYDYKHKYTSGATEYICPAPLPAALAERLGSFAVSAHCGLGCRAYSRSDFRVTAHDDIYILETNTAPGMTATSLVPKAAAASGLSFGDFLSSVVRVSFAIDREF